MQAGGCDCIYITGRSVFRTKPVLGHPGEVSENSYDQPLYTNGLRYDALAKNQDTAEYYKGLIAFRKAHRGLRIPSSDEMRERLVFFDAPENVVSFIINEENEQIFVAYNANEEEVSLTLPEGDDWKLCVTGEKAGCDVLKKISGTCQIAGISAVVAYR